jgi:DNA-binding GntR family transcriptional regulator
MSSDSSETPIRRSLLSIEIARIIKQDILSGRIKPGERLIEATFAERLKTSKSPVREAFRLLEAERLVVSYPHRGSCVINLDKHDLWELDTLRAMLEPYAAQLAVEKIDQKGLEKLEKLVVSMGTATDELALNDVHYRFHTTLTDYAGHGRIVEILNGLWAQMNLVLTITHFGYLEKETVQHDHRILLDAVKSRDPIATRRRFEEHIYQRLPGLLDSLDTESNLNASVSLPLEPIK